MNKPIALTQLAQQAMLPALQPGAIAVDATTGNGHDTLFLAEQLGQEGKVYGFDLQPRALDATRERIANAGLLDSVQLIHSNHSELKKRLAALGVQRVHAVMFNLGYLPGADKACITRRESSLSAVQQALELLTRNGRLSIIAYPGHPGGEAETLAIHQWSQRLDPSRYRVEHMQPSTRLRPAPQWFLIARLH